MLPQGEDSEDLPIRSGKPGLVDRLRFASWRWWRAVLLGGRDGREVRPFTANLTEFAWRSLDSILSSVAASS